LLAYPVFRPEMEKVKLIEIELEKLSLAGSNKVV
jgi:hypothetical protein